MHLRTLRLRQFRSYDRSDLEFTPGLNLLVGPNGAGKSNLLEAVSILAAGESHRGAENKHLFPWDKDAFALEGVFAGEEDVLIEARQQRGRPRQTKVNNAPQKRLRDWLGRVPVVSFSPEDLDLVKGEPSQRRKALNTLLAQALPGYADTLARYAKVLEERNAALKQVQDGRVSVASLEPWDISLLREGAALSLARRQFIALFSPLTAERHRSLSSEREESSLVYKPSFVIPMAPEGIENKGEATEVVAANRRRLQDLRDGEVATGATLIGPHRDDVDFFLDGQPARAFASQGQQRTLAIAFKLAEHAHLRQSLSREPLCLLDDMLSELDPARRGNLRALLGAGAQCLVTMTSLADWDGAADLPGDAKVFEVQAGQALSAGSLRP